MKENWDFAYKKVRVYEGGNDDDPNDNGGRTSRGITQREYDAYRRLRGLPTRDVFKAAEAEITEIYRKSYWDAVDADDLPAGIDYVVWDAAVNSGVAQSVKWAQRAAVAQGIQITVDGQMGPMTRDALKAINPRLAINSMCDQRLAMLQGLSDWKHYSRGWTSRVNDVRRSALSLLSGSKPSAPAVPVVPVEATPKAKVSDRTVVDIAKTPEGLAAGGGIIASVFGAAANGGPVAWAVAIALVAAVLVGGYFFVRRLRQRT